MSQPNIITRRDMLKGAGCGFGYLALAGMCGHMFPSHSSAAMAVAQAYQSPLAPRMPQFAAKAKRVIFLFMQGGPSHIDTFDYKPAGGHASSRGGKGNVLPSLFKFNRYGQSGQMISELFHNVGTQHADDMCILNGMHTDNPAHPQATIALHTGSATFVRPSVGAWVLYGLGTENANLPGFITINPVAGLGGAQNYGSAFLPATFEGTKVDAAGIPDLRNRVLTSAEQRQQLDYVQSLNHDFAGRTGPNEQLDGLIESFELGFRMQGTVPDVMDISNETPETLELYGINGSEGMAGGYGKAAGKKRGPGGSSFGRQCLMARRFAEAGVRFIEVTYPGWDQHQQLKERLTDNCGATDKAIAGLMTDLKRRGLFDDTLIVWGGEFGRTPTSQGTDGRNHNNRGYSMWMAGGGVKGGITHGHTDEIGGEAVDGKVHTHDLHATILALLGLDHERLTFKYAGRDFRLTDVYGNVVKEIIT